VGRERSELHFSLVLPAVIRTLFLAAKPLANPRFQASDWGPSESEVESHLFDPSSPYYGAIFPFHFGLVSSDVLVSVRPSVRPSVGPSFLITLERSTAW